jgi:phosphohistidine phosphatase
MHTLHLLRHAKSSRKQDVDDHARRLSKRGRNEAGRVGKFLPAAVEPLDLVLASSAARTRETLDLALAGFAARPRVLVEDELYLAGAERLLTRLRRLAEDVQAVLVIGHNPGLHELAIALVDGEMPAARPLVAGKLPTAARVSLRVGTPWQELGRERLALLDYVMADSLPGGRD